MAEKATTRVGTPLRALVDVTPMSCSTERWSCTGGTIVVVRVTGEIDLLTCPELRATLDGAVDRTARHLVVDLSGVTFCCLRGLELLADTGPRVAAHDVSYAISGWSAHRERHVRMVRGDSVPVRHYRSCAEAVTSIRAR